MATVRDLCTAALIEIGAASQNQAPSAADMASAFGYFQRQLDAWQADRLTLSFQGQTAITWPSSTSTQTIGPGGDVAIQRPVWINAVNYVIPGTSPAVESPLGPMDQDGYANLSIKALQSGLPTLYFYQTSLDSVLGTLFLWPQPTQTLTLQFYAPKGVDVPTALSDIVLGPPGYQEAYVYQLALRLLNPFGRSAADVPLLIGDNGLAATAYARMKRPNNQPGLLGMDTALIPSNAGGYNILSDNTNAPSAR